MASKMEPVCNSLALSGPPAIHVISRLHGPQGHVSRIHVIPRTSPGGALSKGAAPLERAHVTCVEH